MRVIGLISGTSADGIDAVVCEIENAPPRLSAEIESGTTFQYDPALRRRILASYEPGAATIDEICRLNFAVGEAFAQAALDLIEMSGFAGETIDLVASHGQTVWHEVKADGSVDSTLQMGEAAVIAQRTGITTISNLRSRDVSAGGQGAPLAGYVDWLLLRDPVRARSIQNIGGISNATFLPPLSDSTSVPIAFDNGPGNALIDDVLRLATDGGVKFDEDGAMAGSGTVDEDWLDELMELPYYARKPPKTTGRELFGAAMAAELLQAGETHGLELEDIVATLTALTARSIADSYRRFAPFEIEEVIVGGGGRHNATMMATLQAELAPASVMTQEDIGYNSDYKEALLCAVIGYETWHGRSGNLPSITGASESVIMGDITPGTNYGSLAGRTWRA